jgi:hypothetical protein
MLCACCGDTLHHNREDAVLDSPIQTILRDVFKHENLDGAKLLSGLGKLKDDGFVPLEGGVGRCDSARTWIIINRLQANRGKLGLTEIP